jgi:hypothetical protein
VVRRLFSYIHVYIGLLKLTIVCLIEPVLPETIHNSCYCAGQLGL